MRTRIWIGGAALAVAVAVGSFFSPAAEPAVAAKADAKAPVDDRDQLSDKLMERVTIAEPLENVTLKEAIKYLSERFEITVLVDGSSFSQGGAAVALNAPEDDAVLNQTVTVPAMKKVRLATVLKHITDQINGGYLLYPDHVKFVGVWRVYTLTSPTVKNYYPQGSEDAVMVPPTEISRSIPLVNVNFAEKSLQEALREVETRTNRNVVLAPQAGEKAKAPVTARFTNVPVDTAVATLAEMAGLKMARKGNVLLVTTADRAKEFDPPPPPFATGHGLGFNPWVVDPQIEELKKKVAELEKTIAELKKK